MYSLSEIKVTKGNKIVLHVSILYEYQQFFQHPICFSIQPPDYSDPWPSLAHPSSFFLIRLFNKYVKFLNWIVFSILIYWWKDGKTCNKQTLCIHYQRLRSLKEMLYTLQDQELSKHIGKMCMRLRNGGKGELSRVFSRISRQIHIFTHMLR
jgi:hypothetical protein